VQVQVRSERLADNHTGAGCILSLFFHFLSLFFTALFIHVCQMISCTLSNCLLTQTHSSPLSCLFPCLISLFCSFFIVSGLRMCFLSVHQVCSGSHPRTALSRSDSISSHPLTLVNSLPLSCTRYATHTGARILGPLSHGRTVSLAVSPADSRVLAVTGWPSVSTNDGVEEVFVTHDAGLTWKNLTAGE
jgi:hypothetical protein